MMETPFYFDRKGRPIDVMTWASLFGDLSYRFIADDRVGGSRVATIWVGHNLNFDLHEPPAIFETTVFSPDSKINGRQEHYVTETDARAGHDRTLAWVTTQSRYS